MLLAVKCIILNGKTNFIRSTFNMLRLYTPKVTEQECNFVSDYCMHKYNVNFMKYVLVTKQASFTQIEVNNLKNMHVLDPLQFVKHIFSKDSG